MKKSLQGTFLAIFFISVIISVTGCKKSTDTYPVPLVGTNSVISQLTSTTAISGGLIFNVDAISANGVCWSATNQTPTVADSKTTDTIATHWVSNLTNLLPNTTYYLRAYATGSSGTGYGGVLTFKTNATSAVLVGTVTTIAGSTSGSSGYADGSGSGVLFDGPQSIAYNPLSSLLYIGDSFNNQIRTVTTTGITHTLTSNPAIGFANGTTATAQFYGMKGMSFDAQGNMYVADLGNNMIRKISTTGAVTTYAGNGTAGYVNGAAATAEFYNPQATSVDAQGNVYVADRTNNLIRKITPAGVVSTFTGYLAINGFPQWTVPGFVDGDSATAEFNYPCAMAIDPQGNIFVADLNNRAIRKVTPTGDVTTYAGGGNFPNLIGAPAGIAVDAQDNVFVSDNTGRIIEITAAKVLYVLAGSQNVVGYADGVGAGAKFSNPQGLTLDGQGNLYVADFGNNVIRKVTISMQ
jgi:sugar lactone lactonase YvrE